MIYHDLSVDDLSVDHDISTVVNTKNFAPIFFRVKGGASYPPTQTHQPPDGCGAEGPDEEVDHPHDDVDPERDVEEAQDVHQGSALAKQPMQNNPRSAQERYRYMEIATPDQTEAR